MAYIFPERSEESQESQTDSEQPVPVEESRVQEDTIPVVVESASSSPEASLPPEAQGETNGGPLGCCLGTIFGLFLAFALVTGLSILLSNGGTFITIPATFLGACVGGYLGWRIGKRVYKEYEQPVVKQRLYPARTPYTQAKPRMRKNSPKY